MLNNGTCPDCRTSWDELAGAIHAHIKILGQLQLARMQQNSLVSTELEPLVLAASQRRERARRDYHDHAATHVSEQGKRDGGRSISPVPRLKPR